MKYKQTEEHAEVVGNLIKGMLDRLEIPYTILPANKALDVILN